MGTDSDYVGKLIKEVSTKLRENGMEKVHLQDWRAAMMNELLPLVSRVAHPRSHTKYRRKLEYVLKEMLAALQEKPQHVLDEYKHVKYDWSSLAIKLRITGEDRRKKIPPWVEGSKKEIEVSSFDWNAKEGAYEHPEPEHSIGKNAFRINSRCAQMYGVETYGQHPSGGQRF